MATKTARRKTPAGKGKRRRRSPAPKKKPGISRHLSPWTRDAAGIGLVVVAIIAALSLWFDAAGVIGHGFAYAARGAFGLAAYALPVLAVYWGLLLIRGTAEDVRIRMFLGFAMATLAILGLISLLRGNPGPAAGYESVRVAGGVWGAVMVNPMSRALSEIGAGVVCAGLAILGLLIFSGTPFSSVWKWVRELFARPDTEDAGEAEEEDEEPAEPERRVRRVLRAAPEEEDEEQAGVLVPMPDFPPAPPEPGPPEQLEPEIITSAGSEHRRPAAARGAYKLPPLELLRTAPESTADGLDEEHTMEALERTFETFGVPARVPMAHRGPTVTQFVVEVEQGTKVNKVLALADDIAYALATPDVRIIAPIPGKSAIGVEVPNRHRDFVMLGDILRSKAAREAKHPLTVALGKDVQGRAHMVNLASMPHLLVAGATGAGKSSLMNCFITSLLMRTSPDDVRLVLIDPKRVELAHFADVPHLLSPVIVHPKRAAQALRWLVREMELRYEMLATVGVRDIDGYEEGLAAGTLRIPPGQESKFEHMPFIVVVIDELADLMMIAPRDVEDAICRIAQMARAVGIHLLVATQRPSVDVVTGLIKANIPSRIALMTSSQADSRVVLDMNGAEKLVGHGDLLFAPANASKPTRMQGAWVTQEEIHGVAGFIRNQREPVFDMGVEGLGKPPTAAEENAAEPGSDDDLLNQAMELVISSQLGSTSMLQRKLKVGFARAGRLMDLMEDRGVVGPSQGSKAREVLITSEEWAESRTRSA